jgi:hypothetical protein
MAHPIGPVLFDLEDEANDHGVVGTSADLLAPDNAVVHPVTITQELDCVVARGNRQTESRPAELLSRDPSPIVADDRDAVAAEGRTRRCRTDSDY